MGCAEGQLHLQRIGQQSCCCCQALNSLLDMAMGQERPLMKQLLKLFKPGKTALQGLTEHDGFLSGTI